MDPDSNLARDSNLSRTAMSKVRASLVFVVYRT